MPLSSSSDIIRYILACKCFVRFASIPATQYTSSRMAGIGHKQPFNNLGSPTVLLHMCLKPRSLAAEDGHSNALLSVSFFEIDVDE